MKSAIKSDAALLEQRSKEIIEGLSDEQVVELLKEKWISPLMRSLMQLPQRVVYDLVSKLEALSKIYETTFAELEKEIEDTEQ